MYKAKNKGLVSFLLFTFLFQYILVPSYGVLFLKQLIISPFQGVVSVLSPVEASAQTPPDPTAYTATIIPGNFTDISATGTEILPALSDEGGMTGVPIGFNFNYFGTVFNSLTVTSNGYISFSAVINNQNKPFPSTQTPNGLMAPFWDDLNPGSYPGSAVYYKTLGTAPHRQLVVEWKGYPLAADPGSRLTFEAVLFEGTQEIQFHYLSMMDGSGGTGAGLVSGSSASIGIENLDGTKGTEIAYNQTGSVTGGSAFSFTLGGSGFQTGRLLGDLDGDGSITILDQSILTDYIIETDQPRSSLEILLSDSAPQPGVGGRSFGDGIIDALDHARLFEVVMGRENLNPTLSTASYATAPAGESLTLYGSGFDPVAANNSVLFADLNGIVVATASPDLVSPDGTELTVTVPAGIQFVSVSVKHSGLSSNPIPFVLEGVPVIVSLVPDNGQVGDAVLIRGYEFGQNPADNQVKFNGVSAVVTSVDASGLSDQMIVTVPSGVTTGPLTVTVGGQISNAVTFTVDGPPVVDITSPAEGADLTGLANIIGTVSDMSLVGYTLAYGPVDEGFTAIATGTSNVANDVLGTLDPTLLANGLYRLRLSAEDSGGNISTVTRDFQVSGQNKPGIFTITFTDLQIPVSGIPVTIKRTYDSRKRATSQDFGYGWNLEVVQDGTYKNNRKPGDGWNITSGGGFFHPPCTNSNSTQSHVTEIRFSDTEFYRFAFQVNMSGFGSSIGGGCLGTAEFVQIGGIPGATLVPYNFSGDIFWGNGSDYVQDFDNLGVVFEPQDVQLTTQDGRTYDLNLTHGLTGMGDTNGNALYISNGGVVHSSGKAIFFARDGAGRLTQITDPMGEVLTYAYDASGNLTGFTDRDGNTTTFTYNTGHYLSEIHDPLGKVPLRSEYDSSGRLIAQIDADGNRTEISVDVAVNTTAISNGLGQVTTMTYNDDGLVTEAVSDDGSSLSFTYDAKGNKTSETDQLGNTKTFTYDAGNHLLSETDPLGNTMAYSYDAQGRILSVADAAGNATTNTYDARGNLLSITDPNGAVTNQFTYDASGRMTQMTTLGGTSNLTYDTFGNMTRKQGPGGSDVAFTYDANGRRLTETVTRTTPAGIVQETTSHTYNGSGKILTTTDPLGNVTASTYNSQGQVLSRTDARGNTTTFTYGNRGELAAKHYPDGTAEFFGYDLKARLTAQTDPAGRTTFYEYNRLNKVTRTIHPDGSNDQNTYDLVGSLMSVRDPRGNTTTFGYDVSRHLTQMTDPLGHSTTMTYSDIGAKASETDPLGHLTQFVYDDSAFNLPRLSSTTFADGNTRSKTYDISGRTASEMDENGNTTTFDYDAVGNLIKVTDALGHETTYAYDEIGNRITQTDANGNTTAFEYNAVGRPIKRTLPLGMSETMTYDAVGNMASKTDFNGQTTTFTYDSMNRLVSETLPNSDTLTWTYTPAGKLHTAMDPSGTMTYTYDVRDRVTRIDQPDGTALIYTYDPAGNRTSVQSAAGTTAYTYDALNRLSSVTDPNGGVTTSEYDLAGRLSKTVNANGTETHYAYDGRNRLTIVHHTGGGGSPTLARYDYIFDPAGNRTRMTESTGRVVNYAYDVLHRLIEEDDGTTVVACTYDAVGNRLSKGAEIYTYDANNRLLTAGSATFTYDSNGNLATKVDGTGTTQYTYNSENRLIQQIAPGGAITTFIYDVNGNRISRNEDGTITDFVVDPYDYSGYAQVLAEKNAAGATVAGYTYGNGLLSIDQGGTTHYYHPDGIGSTRLLTDSTGSASDTYTYDAFGNLTSLTGTTPNRYLFAGEQSDPALGLYYLRARYMDPSTGRFISADPFQGSIFQPATLHKYSYANNNPVNYIDPSGQCCMMSVMISISISISLATISIYNLFYKPAKEAYDKIKKLRDEIPAMPMNKSATRTDLLTVTISSDPDELVNLGGGAVDEAYDSVGKMLTDGGKWVSVVHQLNSAYWLAHLQEVGGIPGKYLNCGFNDEVQKMYGLTLVTGLSAAKFFSPAANVVGVYLIYYTFLALVGDTMDDWGMGTIPPQPGGTPPTCP